MSSHNRMVTFTEACPLDYHKTRDQLKRKCHKESLWAVSVRNDIYIERALVGGWYWSYLPVRLDWRLTIKRERNIQAGLSCLLELTQPVGGGGCAEIVRVRGESEGGGGTRVERQVGGRQGMGGRQLRPRVQTQQGGRARGVTQWGGGRDPETENILILSSRTHCKSSVTLPAQFLQLSS